MYKGEKNALKHSKDEKKKIYIECANTQFIHQYVFNFLILFCFYLVAKSCTVTGVLIVLWNTIIVLNIPLLLSFYYLIDFVDGVYDDTRMVMWLKKILLALR